MKSFKTMIYNPDEKKKEIIEVKGHNINQELFAYKDEKGYYFLVDKNSGFSLRKYHSLKELKLNVDEVMKRFYEFKEKYKEKYECLVRDFNELI